MKKHSSVTNTVNRTTTATNKEEDGKEKQKHKQTGEFKVWLILQVMR